MRVENRGRSSFGWKHSTHKLVTEKMVSKYNVFMPKSEEFNYEILKYSCIQPDLERKNITKYNHGHFADIDNLSKDPTDAYALTIRYTKKAIEAHKNGLYSKRDDYLGYALHFLLDELDPMHVIFRPIPKEHPDRVLHREVENAAERIQDLVIDSTALNHSLSDKHFFSEVLPQAMRKNKELFSQVMNNKSTDNISKVSAMGLGNAYKTTDLFFQKLVDEFNKAECPTLVKEAI